MAVNEITGLLWDQLQFAYSEDSIQIQKVLHKDVKSISDRLNSIWTDALFVQSVVESFRLPVAVNERCGRWYVPSHHEPISVYFKSTDGHQNHCKFSLRRLNLHVLPKVRESAGLIIVDSTRRGKRMPDAISKTIPIWCCVINRVVSTMLQRNWSESQLALHTPFQVVSKIEEHQIALQVDFWVTSFLATGIDREVLTQLDKPLRPIWITPESSLPQDHNRFQDAEFYPLVLVTASRCVPDGVERQRGFVYVQGAADDEEMWSQGLKPDTFWAAPERHLNLDPAAFGQSSLTLKGSSRDSRTTREVEGDRIVRLRRTSIYLTNQVRIQDLQDYSIIDLSLTAQLTCDKSDYSHFAIEDGKRGISNLFKIFALVDDELIKQGTEQRPLLITDDQNCKTKAAVIALLVLVLYYDADDNLRERSTRMNKETVKNRMVTLVNCRQGLNPSRAALKSLNEYLMSGSYKPSSTRHECTTRAMAT